MSSWHNYPSIYNLGHSAINELFLDDVLVEEKVDGSQFSFGIFDGVYRFKSKNRELFDNQSAGMFNCAVDVVKTLPLHDGWTYRGEYLQKPKHNTLAYERVPNQYIILFDINTAEETYLTRSEKEYEANRIGLEIVPVLYEGKIHNTQIIDDMLNSTSILGAQHIEGVVIKNYLRFGKDKKVLMGKYVSEKFKERNSHRPTTRGDIITNIINTYRCESRWDKAVFHLRDNNILENTPTDIGKIIVEVHRDITKECKDEIMEKLWGAYYKTIVGGITKGIPEWYKNKLMNTMFPPTKEV